MKKIALAITSTSGIDYVKLNIPIEVLRLTVHFDGKEYIDHTEIKANDFYQMMLDKPNADISTSQASAGKVAESYEKLKSEGYTDVIVIAVSSKLSGSYQGCILAKSMVEGINVHVVDSMSASFGEALLALEAEKMIKDGLEASIIVEKLEKIRDNINIFFLVDTLKYLVKNGRLSQTSGFLGTLLKIKPILKIVDGKLIPFEKIRTTAKAQEALVRNVLDGIKGKENIRAFILYTLDEKLALEQKERIQKQNPKAEVTLLPLTPVVGAHTGPGAMGIGYVELD
ncbi:DegV family protein [Alteracholeplasma palmae J233]|uniref:DegV family protein n=1 Tax=Alteracholeplasma palmae (strain ATCC 49389 / J233) TaxID=1318466 RepID=U4KSE2_ALTPJ|nr:DegV family protein [Alteracholeplasma palmae]CCV64931.1 DegV family protein [Alteracholeplasma palmae J233]